MYDNIDYETSSFFDCIQRMRDFVYDFLILPRHEDLPAMSKHKASEIKNYVRARVTNLVRTFLFFLFKMICRN